MLLCCFFWRCAADMCCCCWRCCCPGIPGFPMSYDGTSQKCDASVAVFRCRLGGAEKAAPKRFSFRRFI